MVVPSVVELTFNETAMFTSLHAKATASNRLAKATRASQNQRLTEAHKVLCSAGEIA